MKALSVVGNRPQFIKSGPLSVALREHEIDEVVVHTGQHYDRALSDAFFEELGLPEPDYRLGLKTADPEAMEPAIAATVVREQPDAVVVFGDTNSTLAGARAGARAGIPVAHVEAGLRSGDLEMPEERNRIEVDRISRLLLAPDERSRQTLLTEGVHGSAVVVGDVMADASMRLAPVARARSDALERLGVEPGRYLVVTVHRQANVRMPRLGRIVEGLRRLEERLVFPAHPRTRAALDERGEDRGGHVLDVALAAVQPLDDARIDVEEDDGLSGLGEDPSERHADVAGADDGNVGHDRRSV